MAEEMRADPGDLANLADGFLTESIDLFDGLKAARGETSVPAEAFGNSDSAAAVQAAYTLALEAAGVDLERLITVCEEDMDGLYQTAFAFQLQDQQTSDQVNGAAPTP